MCSRSSSLAFSQPRTWWSQSSDSKRRKTGDSIYCNCYEIFMSLFLGICFPSFPSLPRLSCSLLYPRSLQQCLEVARVSVNSIKYTDRQMNECLSLTLQPRTPAAQAGLRRQGLWKGALAPASEAWAWAPSLAPGCWVTLGKSQTSLWVSAKLIKPEPGFSTCIIKNPRI